MTEVAKVGVHSSIYELYRCIKIHGDGGESKSRLLKAAAGQSLILVSYKLQTLVLLGQGRCT